MITFISVVQHDLYFLIAHRKDAFFSPSKRIKYGLGFCKSYSQSNDKTKENERVCQRIGFLYGIKNFKTNDI